MSRPTPPATQASNEQERTALEPKWLEPKWLRMQNWTYVVGRGDTVRRGHTALGRARAGAVFYHRVALTRRLRPPAAAPKC